MERQRRVRLKNYEKKLVVSDYLSGITAEALSKKYKIGWTTVYGILDQAGVQRRRAARQRELMLTPVEQKKIVEWYKHGWSVETIATKLGRGRTIVDNTLKDYKVQKRPSAVPQSYTHRVCFKCNKEKLLEEFHRSTKTLGRAYACKECDKDIKIEAKFGKTRKEYNQMLQQQGNKCKICGTKERHLANCERENLVIDHNHATGKVRGILCYNCNSALGYFYENIDTLYNAIHYLQCDPRPLWYWVKQPLKLLPSVDSAALAGFVKYGITKLQFMFVFELQERSCAVCATTKFTYKNGARPAIDCIGDKKWENVRGVLCGTCKAGLVKFLDDPNSIKKAIKYLREYS